MDTRPSQELVHCLGSPSPQIRLVLCTSQDQDLLGLVFRLRVLQFRPQLGDAFLFEFREPAQQTAASPYQQTTQCRCRQSVQLALRVAAISLAHSLHSARIQACRAEWFHTTAPLRSHQHVHWGRIQLICSKPDSFPKWRPCSQ